MALNHDTCTRIRAVTEASNIKALIDLVEPVVKLGTGKNWRDMLERRGEDFHRWRPQTHGVEGVSRKSPWRKEAGSRVLSLKRPVYEDARGLADQTARLATTAMLDLADSMEIFMERWPAASSALGGPKFRSTS